MDTSSAPSFKIIVAGAITEEAGKYCIGSEGKLPWRCPPDMTYFNKKTTTTQSESKANVVIMGRKTWESIPEKFRPLPDRLNIIISQKIFEAEPGYEKYQLPPTVKVFPDLDRALCYLGYDKIAQQFIEDVWVIGGGELYSQAVFHPNCVTVLLTEIKPAQPIEKPDTFFQIRVDDDWQLLDNEEYKPEPEFQEDKLGNKYRFLAYVPSHWKNDSEKETEQKEELQPPVYL